jgi:iron complex transport system substrate-binding protein
MHDLTRHIQSPIPSRPGHAAILAGALLLAGTLGAAAQSPTPDGASTASPTAGGRTVTHLLGTTEVPADPQRVVTLEAESLDPVLALGVTPVGTGTFADRIPIPAYLNAPEGITDVGAGEPDLERVALLEPDLIIGMNWAVEPVQSELNQIAPTVALDGTATNWKANLQIVAAALGRQAEADAAMAVYEARTQELAAALGDRLPTTEVSVVRFRQDQVLAYVKSSFSGGIIEDVGLPRPQAQDVAGDFTFVEMSAEQIPQMDGDVMFVFTLGEAGQAQYEAFTSNPLWGRLQVVQDGRVHEVSLEYWNGPNLLAANALLDDLERTLVEEW